MADKPQSIKAYKGFNPDMTCRGYQFEVGKTYTHDGVVAACKSGFHSCEYPLDVFNYYTPASSVFAEVDAAGTIARHNQDSKIASSVLTIKASIDLPGIIKAAIEYTFSRCKPVDPKSPASATGDQGAASATGYQGAASATAYQGAASATGDHGAASATGYQGAASATGTRGAASATGTRGAASATGTRGAASATGEHSVAIGCGYEASAMAAATGAIVLVHRNDDGEIIHIRASKVGENGIKAGVFYTLNEAGEFVEVK